MAEDSVAFDINRGLLHESFNPAVMAAFAEGLNVWLEQGKLLMNTDEEAVIYMDPLHPRESFVNLWKIFEPAEAYDQKLSLERNLKQLAEEVGL